MSDSRIAATDAKEGQDGTAPQPARSAPAAPNAPSAGPVASSANLKLTDIINPHALQEIQDGFAALTRLRTSIVDAQGNPITEPTELEQRTLSDVTLDWLIDGDEQVPEGRVSLSAPIVVEGHQIGSIRIESHQPTGVPISPLQVAQFRQKMAHLPLSEQQIEQIVEAAHQCWGFNRAAGVQFLDVLANNLARLCYQEFQLRQRVEELSALYRLSTVLAAHRDVQQILDTAARSAAEVLGVRRSAIRLLSEDGDEMVVHAGHNLSRAYLSRGPLTLSESELFNAAIRGQVVYVPDMTTDPRVRYREAARREGLVSALFAGMIYQDQPIGVIQLFTEQRRAFSPFEINLVRAIAQMLAAAIENARLEAKRRENEDVQRQLQIASQVQQRMLPSSPPRIDPFDIAARYVPCFELGGDFYDFLRLEDHLGVAVGDVVGKGIAASLLMAMVRASLGAYAQDVYDLDEVIRRVNVALTRDTLDREFATLWYGVLDPRHPRLTYCNAGHEPALLLRGGRVEQLGRGGMVVGVDLHQRYERTVIDLQPGDVLLAFTDGLCDAANFDGERFGRRRILEALRAAADKSAADILNHVLWELRRYIGLNRAADDTTLVVIKVREGADPRPDPDVET